MSYKSNGFSAISYANGFTLWHYRTTDESVGTPGYFNDAHKMLRVGDFLMVNLAVNGPEQAHEIICVVGNEGGVVSISPMVVAGWRGHD